MKKILSILVILSMCFTYIYNYTPYKVWLVKYYFEKGIKLNYKNNKLVTNTVAQGTFHPSSPSSPLNQEFEDNIDEMNALFEKSDIILTKLIKKDPDNFKLRTMQIYFDMYINKYDKVVDNIKNMLFQSNINKNNWNDVKTLNNEKCLLKYIQDIQTELFKYELDFKVEEIALEVLKYYPNHFESMNTLGVIYIFNEFDKAEEYFNKARVLAPDDEIIKNNLKQLKFLRENDFVFLLEKRGELSFYMKKGSGIYAVKDNKILFKVFNFDNGPDYLEHGLFRIIDENDLIGFADEKGNVIIKPQFKFATIQEDGNIRASNTGYFKSVGEYKQFVSDEWFIVKNPKIKTNYMKSSIF